MLRELTFKLDQLMQAGHKDDHFSPVIDSLNGGASTGTAETDNNHIGFFIPLS